jgi:hypothetical protein
MHQKILKLGLIMKTSKVCSLKVKLICAGNNMGIIILKLG